MKVLFKNELQGKIRKTRISRLSQISRNAVHSEENIRKCKLIRHLSKIPHFTYKQKRALQNVYKIQYIAMSAQRNVMNRSPLYLSFIALRLKVLQKDAKIRFAL